jgi:hypothetical protein
MDTKLIQNPVTIYKGWEIHEIDGFYAWACDDELFDTLDEIKDHIDEVIPEDFESTDEDDYDDSEEQREFEDHWQNVQY